MATPKINELTDKQIAVRYSDRVFRPVANTLTVPDTLAGKYMVTVGVIVDQELGDGGEGVLENAIEAIDGVDLAKVIIGTSRLSLDRMPADTQDVDYQFRVQFRMGFDVAPVTLVPVPETQEP